MTGAKTFLLITPAVVVPPRTLSPETLLAPDGKIQAQATQVEYSKSRFTLHPYRKSNSQNMVHVSSAAVESL